MYIYYCVNAYYITLFHEFYFFKAFIIYFLKAKYKAKIIFLKKTASKRDHITASVQ